MKEILKKELVFEEITDNQMFAEYTADCSGDVSDCCTRVCTRECDDDDDECILTEEAWGEFLNVEGGVIQY